MNRWTSCDTTPSIRRTSSARYSRRSRAADPDLALVVVPEPQQQVDQRRLARRRSARRSRGCRRPGRQVEAVEDRRLAGAVAEAQAADLDAEVGGDGRAGRVAAGRRPAARASVSSNSRRAAASLASCSWTAWASGADDLEAGDGRERQEREEDAVEPARADERDADREDRRRRRGSRAGGRVRRRRRGPAAQLGRRPVESAPSASSALAVVGRPVEGEQVGDAPRPRRRASRSARRATRSRPSAGRRESRRETSGRTTPVTTRNASRTTPRIGVEDAEQEAAERRHERGDDRRHDDADVEVLERVDVGDDPGEAGRRARWPVRPAGRERLDRRRRTRPAGRPGSRTSRGG